MKPVIGITSDYESDRNSFSVDKHYIQAVGQTGGTPVILPFINEREKTSAIESTVSHIDALIISGGDFDIDPVYYNEARHRKIGRLIPERTAYEFALFKAALDKNLPILGICNGLQLINIAFGGSLYQDLPEQLKTPLIHEKRGSKPRHNIFIDPQSILYTTLQTTEIEVTSTHHQAIKFLAPKLKATAWAQDGVIEAVESTANRFVIGVQWHPERLINDNHIWKGLFNKLIQAAS